MVRFFRGYVKGGVLRFLAPLGGWVGRRGDGEPGVTVLWKGVMALTHLTGMYRLLRPPARA